jgi:hypothetical protein
MSTVNNDFTLYAKWNDATPSAVLIFSAKTSLQGQAPTVAPGFYADVVLRNSSEEETNLSYSQVNRINTRHIYIVPGTYTICYRFYNSYTDIQNNRYMFVTRNFTISARQSRVVTLDGTGVYIGEAQDIQ